jgi:hypothetical protein
MPSPQARFGTMTTYAPPNGVSKHCGRQARGRKRHRKIPGGKTFEKVFPPDPPFKTFWVYAACADVRTREGLMAA